MNLKKALLEYENLLVDFYSEDCPPCKVQEEQLRLLADKEVDLTKILQVDKEKNPEVFEAFSIKNLPHLKFFKKGKPIWNYTGILEAQEIAKRIKNGKF